MRTVDGLSLNSTLLISADSGVTRVSQGRQRPLSQESYSEG